MEKYFIRSWLFILIVAIISSGCGNKNSGHANGERLVDSVNTYLTALDTRAISPAEKLKNLQTFYDNFSDAQQEQIFRPVFTKLFFTAYAHPDTTVLNFFRRVSKNQQNKDVIRIDAYFKRAAYYLYINQQPDSGIKNLRRAIKFQYRFNDTLYKSYYTLYAQALMQKGSLNKAAKYYLEAIKIIERMNDSAQLIGNMGNLANVYDEMDDEHKAIPLKKLSLGYFERKKDSGSAFIGNVSLGTSYSNLGNADSALYFYKRALKLLDAGINNPSIAFILYNNLGDIYTTRKELAKARFYFELSKPILNEFNSESQNHIFTIYSTPAYSMERDVSKDIAAIRQYAAAYLKSNDLSNGRKALHSLYQIAAFKGDDKAALAYYLQFDSVTNLMLNRLNNRDIVELRTKYDSQKKELRIEIQERQLAQKNSFNHLLILIIVILISSIAFLSTRSTLKRKKKEVQQQQQFMQQLLQKTEEERGRIARDLHDGLSQDLLLLKNQIQQITPAKIDAVINEVRAISRNIHPTMLDQIGFKSSIMTICEQIMRTEKLFVTANIEYGRSLNKQKELQLFRIIQEALNNIIKNADATAARIDILESGDRLEVTIKDNGHGFNVEQALSSKSSFGLLSMMERSRALNGKARIESGAGGTIIYIDIPQDPPSKAKGGFIGPRRD